VIHACQAACVSRSVSSPRPPTGLADGFGLEKPYGGPARPCTASQARRFTPGIRVGPRLPDRLAGGQELGGLHGLPSGACNGYQRWTLTESAIVVGRNKEEFSPRAPPLASPHCRLRTWRAHAYMVRARRALWRLPGIAAGHTACLQSRSDGRRRANARAARRLRLTGSADQALRWQSHLAVVSVFGILTSEATQLP